MLLTNKGGIASCEASIFRQVQRIVVKVGTSTLTYPNGKLNLNRIEHLVRELADISNSGKEIVLVSSGAVGAGAGKLGLKRRHETIPEKQAAAAIGQGLLMQFYEKLFSEYGLVVGQILLTRDDINDRKRYLNCRNAFGSLLSYGAIPIVNENDTVAVEELGFGDNDTLSALVASLINADLLIILSDVDGIYSSDPRQDSKAKLIEIIEEIDTELEEVAGGAGSAHGTGGMATKIQAAKIASNSGTAMVIANGAIDGVLRRIVLGENLGSFFVPQDALCNRKRWLAFHRRSEGSIAVDDGARRALLHQGKSLLPSGVIAASGAFMAGALVDILDREGHKIARGLTNYSRDEIDSIKGRRSAEIESVLGYRSYDELIHRDNLVVSDHRSEGNEGDEVGVE